MADRAQLFTAGELQEQVDAAILELAKLDVFQRAGSLVDVVRDATVQDGTVRPDGSPRIRALPRGRLRELLDAAIEWQRPTPKGGVAPARVPQDVVLAVESRGEWAHVRPLDGIVQWPVLRPDGSILSAPGYDAATRLLCEPAVHVEVPRQPTQEDARYALEALQELVVDSPFATPAHRSAWIAALLTVLARPAIDGPVPLTLIDANTPGAGKTTLADLIGIVATGQALPRRTVPDDSAEWDKTMLAIALAADPVLLIDNVTRKLRSDALDTVLTGTRFQGRLLGKNEQVSLPVRTVFLVTSNNVDTSADLVRRSLHVRLEAREEQPERRSDWQYPDVLGYARQQRVHLLRHALTILRAYVVAGRPKVGMLPMGSYEVWSGAVRAALVWAGAADPGETQEGLREAADTEREAVADLLRALHSRYGHRATTVGEILSDAGTEEPRGRELRHAVLGFCDSRAGNLPSPKQLGNALRRQRGKIVDSLLLESAGKGNAGARWRVRAWAASDSRDSRDSVSNPREAESEDPIYGGAGNTVTTVTTVTLHGGAQP